MRIAAFERGLRARDRARRFARLVCFGRKPLLRLGEERSDLYEEGGGSGVRTLERLDSSETTNDSTRLLHWDDRTDGDVRFSHGSVPTSTLPPGKASPAQPA